MSVRVGGPSPGRASDGRRDLGRVEPDTIAHLRLAVDRVSYRLLELVVSLGEQGVLAV